MRLIDADKVKRAFIGNRYGTKAIEYVIDDAPTVKAITIEWIKNYARHKASKGFTEIDCYWQYWEDDVLKMVDEWEKENEYKESN